MPEDTNVNAAPRSRARCTRADTTRTAMLVSAAAFVQATRATRWPCDVHVPAWEEYFHGARHMIDDGLLDNCHPTRRSRSTLRRMHRRACCRPKPARCCIRRRQDRGAAAAAMRRCCITRSTRFRSPARSPPRCTAGNPADRRVRSGGDDRPDPGGLDRQRHSGDGTAYRRPIGFRESRAKAFRVTRSRRTSRARRGRWWKSNRGSW